jgi:Tfp pilus assembly protein PilO
MDKELKEFYLNNKFAIWPVISGAAVILMLSLVIIPRAMSLMEVNKQISQTQDKIQLLNEKATKLESINKDELEQQLEVVLTVLPLTDAVPDALTVIQSLMSKSSLNLQTTNYVAASKTAGLNYSTIRLSAAGKVASVKDFLINLNDAPRLFQVESVSLTFSKDGDDTSLDIPLSIISAPAPETIGTIDQPLPVLSEQDKSLITQFKQSIDALTQSSTQSAQVAVPLGKEDPFN